MWDWLALAQSWVVSGLAFVAASLTFKFEQIWANRMVMSEFKTKSWHEEWHDLWCFLLVIIKINFL